MHGGVQYGGAHSDRPFYTPSNDHAATRDAERGANRQRSLQRRQHVHAARIDFLRARCEGERLRS